jgi:hypothetical protein
MGFFFSSPEQTLAFIQFQILTIDECCKGVHKLSLIQLHSSQQLNDAHTIYEFKKKSVSIENIYMYVFFFKLHCQS